MAVPRPFQRARAALTVASSSQVAVAAVVPASAVATAARAALAATTRVATAVLKAQGSHKVVAAVRHPVAPAGTVI